jgi:hypothetical protein
MLLGALCHASLYSVDLEDIVLCWGEERPHSAQSGRNWSKFFWQDLDVPRKPIASGDAEARKVTYS